MRTSLKNIATLTFCCLVGILFPNTVQAQEFFTNQTLSPEYRFNGPAAVVSADFDLDGDIDIIVSSYGSSTDSTLILLNNGNGNFSDSLLSQTAGLMKMGDLNGDGYPDLVHTSFEDGKLRVLTSDSSGSFRSTNQNFATVGGGIALGDINKDGIDDLLTYQYTHPDSNILTGRPVIWLNNGNGQFSIKQIFNDQSFDQSSNGLLLDVNGDGYADFINSDHFAGNSVVFFNLGDGNFNNINKDTIPIGTITNHLDIDNDGDQDLVGRFGWDSLGVCINDGTGNYSLVQKVKLPDVPLYGNLHYGIGEFNDDGYLDLFVHNDRSSSSDFLYLNNGDGTFSLAKSSGLNESYSTTKVAVADFTGDGRDDVYVLGRNGNPAKMLSGNFTATIWSEQSTTVSSIQTSFDCNAAVSVDISGTNTESIYQLIESESCEVIDQKKGGQSTLNLSGGMLFDTTTFDLLAFKDTTKDKALFIKKLTDETDNKLNFNGRPFYQACQENGASFTIEAWVNLNGESEVPLMRGEDVDGENTVIGSNIFVKDGVLNVFGPTNYSTSPNLKVVIPNVHCGWHHIAVVYDHLVGSNNWTAYFDGVAVNPEINVGFGNGVGWTNDHYYLSTYNNSKGFFLDDYRIWSKAITANQIKSLKNRVLLGKHPDLVANYRFTSIDNNIIICSNGGNYNISLSGIQSSIEEVRPYCISHQSDAITFNVAGIQDRDISINQTTTIYKGYARIDIPNSQQGVNYYLRNDANNDTLAGPATGDGSKLELLHSPIKDTTTYNVLAVRNNCSFQLSEKLTVNVLPEEPKFQSSVSFSANPSEILCSGNSEITISNTTEDYVYQLINSKTNKVVVQDTSTSDNTNVVLNTGTISDTTKLTVVSYRAGDLENCLAVVPYSFSGFGVYEFSNKPFINATSNNDKDFTVEFWFNMNGKSFMSPMIAKDANGNITSNILVTDTSISLYENGSFMIHAKTQNIDTGWHHVAIQYEDFFQQGSVAINGQSLSLSVNRSFSNPNGFSGATFELSGTYDVHTYLKNYRIWSSTRTDNQLTNNLYKLNPSDAAFLVANYPFNSFTGDSSPDESGNGFTFRKKDSHFSSNIHIAQVQPKWVFTWPNAVTINATGVVEKTILVKNRSSCSTSATIQLVESQNGVNYYLRNDLSNDTILGPLVGNGDTLAFTLSNLATSASYNVLGSLNGCDSVLSNKPYIEVNIINQAAVSSDVSTLYCQGDVIVSLDATQSSVSYYLINDATGDTLQGPVTGTGSAMSFQADNISAARTYRVDATLNSCSLSLNQKPSVAFDPINPLNITSNISTAICKADPIITIENSQAGVDYELRKVSDNSLLVTSISGNGQNISFNSFSTSQTIQVMVVGKKNSCTKDMANTLEIVIEDLQDYALTIDNITEICEDSVAISFANSQLGVSYALFDATDTSYMGKTYLGDGTSFSFTDIHVQENTSFIVKATKDDCELFLSDRPNVSIAPLSQFAVNSNLNQADCEAAVQIEIAAAQSGVRYSLRDLDDNTLIDGPKVAPNNSALSFNVDSITQSRNYKVVAEYKSCGITMTDTESVVIDVINQANVSADKSLLNCPGDVIVSLDASEAKVSYYLVNKDNGDTLQGPVLGTGTAMSFQADNISAARNYKVLAQLDNCSLSLNNEPSVGYEPITELNVSSNIDSSICKAEPVISVLTSQNGISYNLRKVSDNSLVRGPITGTGEDIAFNSIYLNESTELKVVGSIGSCELEMANRITVVVEKLFDINLSISNNHEICEDSVNISLDSSQAGVLYSLHNASNGAQVGLDVNGTGAGIAFQNIHVQNTTTFYVEAKKDTCRLILEDRPTITIDALSAFTVTSDVDSSICRASVLISTSGSQQGTYLRLLDDDFGAALQPMVFANSNSEINFSPDNITDSRRYRVESNYKGCTRVMDGKPLVEITPVKDRNIQIVTPEITCGDNGNVKVFQSQVGVQYYLRTSEGDTISTFSQGDGQDLILTTAPLSKTTNLNVIAEPTNASKDKRLACMRILSGGIKITINNLATVPIYPAVDRQICIGGTQELSIDAINNANYQWYFNNQEISGTNQENYGATETGYYKARYTLGQCFGFSDSIHVEEFSAFSAINVDHVDDTICEAQSSNILISNLQENVIYYLVDQEGLYRDGPILGKSNESISLNTGTLSKSESYVIKALKGKNGSFVEFDGIDEYIHTNTNISLNNVFTLEAWALFDPLKSSNGSILSFNKNQGSGDWMKMGLSQGKLELNINNQNIYSSKSTIQDGAWHFLAISKDQDSIYFYIDGKLDTSYVHTNDIEISRPLFTGASEAGIANGQASISNIAIWNEAKLAKDIRTDSYSCQTSSSNLELFYNFEQFVDENTIADLSSKNRNGSLLNFTRNSTKLNAPISCDVCEITYADSIKISVTLKPRLQIEPIVEARICDGDSYLLHVPKSSQTESFQWFRDGQNIQETENTYKAFEPGLYKALVTDKGCSNYTNSTLVKRFKVNEVELSSNTELLCYGDTLVLKTDSSELNTRYNLYNGFEAFTFQYGTGDSLTWKFPDLFAGQQLNLKIKEVEKFVDQEAISFDGIDDYAKIYKLGEILENKTTWSLDFSIKSVQTALSIFQFGENAYALSIDGQGSIQFSDKAGLTSISSVAGAYSGDGNWHHIALDVNQNNAKIYVDGNEVSTNQNSFTGFDSDIKILDLTIAKSGTVYSAFAFDELRFFTDRSRSQQEISGTKHEQIDGYDNLVAYYKLQNVGETKIRDFSGKFRDGEIFNALPTDIWVNGAFGQKKCYREMPKELQITVARQINRTVNLVGNDSICAGTTTRLETENPNGYSYKWQKDGALLESENNPSLEISETAEYRAIITSDQNCVDTSASFFVQRFEVENVAIELSTDSVCNGDTVDIRLMSTQDIVNYQLVYADGGEQIGAPFFGNGSDISIKSPAINGLTRLQFTTRIGEGEQPICQGQLDTILTVYGLSDPSAEIERLHQEVVCEGDSSVLMVVTDSGTKFQWKREGQAITNDTSNSYLVTETGYYSVFVDNGIGCTSESEEILVEILVNQDQNWSLDTNEICSNNNVRVKLSDTEEGKSYLLINQANHAVLSKATSVNGGTLEFDSPALDKDISVKVVVEANHEKRKGLGISFNGQNQYLQAADGGGTNDLEKGTIEFWVKWNGSQANGFANCYGAIMARQENFVASSMIIGLDNSNPDDAHIVWRGNSAENNLLTSKSTISDSTWHHIAISFENNSGYHRLFLDGKIEDSIAVSNFSFNTPNTVPLFLGAWPGDGASYSRAVVDEFRVWNTARSEKDIRLHKNTCFEGSEEGLVSYFKMEAGKGTDLLRNNVSSGPPALLVNLNADSAWVDGASPCGACYSDLNGNQSITVNPIPQAAISSPVSPAEFCEEGELELTANVVANSTYNFFLNGVSEQSTQQNTFACKDSGYVYVQVISDKLCSAISDSILVKQNPLPHKESILKAPTGASACMGTSVTLVSSGPVDYSYSWKRDGGLISGEISPSISTTLPGSYSVLVSDKKACTKESNSIGLQFYEIPEGTISSSLSTLCKGDSLLITLSGLSKDAVYEVRNQNTGKLVDSPVDGISSSQSFYLNPRQVGANTLSVKARLKSKAFESKGNTVEEASYALFTNAPGNITNQLSIESWVKIDASGFLNAGQAKHLQDNSSTNTWLWEAQGTAFKFYVNAAGSWNILSYEKRLSQGWHHIATVYDAGKMSLYVDGELKIEQLASDPNLIQVANESSITLGIDPRFSPALGRMSSNAFDEFRVWNKALNQNDIQSKLRDCLNGDESGLILYANFEEGSGNKISDLSPSKSQGEIRSTTGEYGWIVSDFSSCNCSKDFSDNQNFTLLDSPLDNMPKDILDTLKSCSAEAIFSLQNTFKEYNYTVLQNNVAIANKLGSGSLTSNTGGVIAINLNQFEANKDLELRVTQVSNSCAVKANSKTYVKNVGAGKSFLSHFLIADEACVGDTLFLISQIDPNIKPTRVEWSFGDNTSSTQLYPEKVYSQAGQYLVKVTAFDKDCPNESLQKNVTISQCAAQLNTNAWLYNDWLAPNPNYGSFSYSCSFPEELDAKLELITLSGQILERYYLDARMNVEQDFTIAKPGIYILKLTSAYASKSYRIVVL